MAIKNPDDENSSIDLMDYTEASTSAYSVSIFTNKELSELQKSAISVNKQTEKFRTTSTQADKALADFKKGNRILFIVLVIILFLFIFISLTFLGILIHKKYFLNKIN